MIEYNKSEVDEALGMILSKDAAGAVFGFALLINAEKQLTEDDKLRIAQAITPGEKFLKDISSEKSIRNKVRSARKRFVYAFDMVEHMIRCNEKWNKRTKIDVG